MNKWDLLTRTLFTDYVIFIILICIRIDILPVSIYTVERPGFKSKSGHTNVGKLNIRSNQRKKALPYASRSGNGPQGRGRTVTVT